MSRLKLVREVGNWVTGERFWDRVQESRDLKELIDEGANVLICAPRRVGKTSLMRQLEGELQQLGYVCLFIDLERAQSPEDAIVEIGSATRPHQSIWSRALQVFKEKAAQIESLEAYDIKIALRESLQRGWVAKGEQLFEVLAGSDKPVVVFMDELPILVNRLLKGDDYTITPERRKTADLFLSFLRAATIKHRSKVRLVVAGSIGLEPVLRQAGLSATVNTYTPFELLPWDDATAIGCLGALAANYEVTLGAGVPERIVQKLGSCVPHHVQMFFNHLLNDAKRRDRMEVSTEDVERVYAKSMLGTRGHAELSHMEERLKLVLGPADLPLALDILYEAAVTGQLTPIAALSLAHDNAASSGAASEDRSQESLQRSIAILEHDGYLVRDGDGYSFASHLLRDWLKQRAEAWFSPASKRGAR